MNKSNKALNYHFENNENNFENNHASDNDNHERTSHVRLIKRNHRLLTSKEIEDRIHQIEFEVLHGDQEVHFPKLDPLLIFEIKPSNEPLIPSRTISVGTTSTERLTPTRTIFLEKLEKVSKPNPGPAINCSSETPMEVANQIGEEMRLARNTATHQWQQLSIWERIKRTFTGRDLENQMSLKELKIEMQKISQASPSKLIPGTAPRLIQVPAQSPQHLPQKSFMDRVKSTFSSFSKSLIAAKNAFFSLGSDPAVQRSKVKKGMGVTAIAAATALSGFALAESCSKGGGNGPFNPQLNTKTNPLPTDAEEKKAQEKPVDQLPRTESQSPLQAPSKAKSSTLPKEYNKPKTETKKTLAAAGNVCQKNTKLVTGDECIMPDSDASRLRGDLQAQFNQLTKGIATVFSPIQAPNYNVYTPHFKGKYKFSHTTFNDDNPSGVVKTQFAVDKREEAGMQAMAKELQQLINSAKTPQDFSKIITRTQTLRTALDKKIAQRAATIAEEVRQAVAFNIDSAENKIANVEARYPGHTVVAIPSNYGTMTNDLNIRKAHQTIATQKANLQKPQTIESPTTNEDEMENRLRSVRNQIVQNYYDLENLHRTLDDVIAEHYIRPTLVQPKLAASLGGNTKPCD